MKKKKNLFYYLKKDRFIYLLMLPGLIWYLVLLLKTINRSGESKESLLQTG